MSAGSEKPNHSRPSEDLEMDFRSAEFPSDAISIKRLRVAFRNHFDRPGPLIDGYCDNDFFYPFDSEKKTEHLRRLTNLLGDERTVASAAFYEQYLKLHPGSLSFDDDELRVIEGSRRRLETDYQYFKLADSPESARLMIRQVEEEGEKQASQSQTRRR